MIEETCFRMAPRLCFESQSEQMIIVQNSFQISQPTPEDWNADAEPVIPDKKKPAPVKGKVEEEPPAPPKEEIKISDFEVLVKNPIPVKQKDGSY